MAFSNNKQRIVALEDTVAWLKRDKALLDTVVDRADVRLDQYGPTLAELLEDEVTGHTAGRWQSQTDTAHYRIIVNNRPGASYLALVATQHSDVPEFRRGLAKLGGSDFTESELQEMEDWTTWARTGAPVNTARHADRKAALDGLLS